MSQLPLLFDTPDAPLAVREADAFGHILSPEQARVRDAGSGHLVVVAGAGTGKTELLTQRVLKLLLDGGEEGAPTELEGVVALTFTNKAAAEMRSRVYRALVRRLRRTQDAGERARLLGLRARFAEENRIWTFDSLGARLLAMFPDAAALSRNARLPTAGEERALVRALRREFWAWADSFDTPEAEELFAFLDIFERRENALLLIRDTARRPREEVERLARLPEFGDYAALLLDVLDERADRLWQAHNLAVERLADIAPSLRGRLLDPNIVKAPVKSGGVLTGTGWSAPVAREFPPTLSDSAKTALAKRLLAWREAVADGDVRRDALGWCDEQGVGAPLWEREWRSRCAVASLARYAKWWENAERAWKAARGLADFADVSRATLELLRDPAVSAALQGEIEWLLVDEFQDTNREQWQVIEGLRRRAAEGNGTKGNTLLVGDPKQAIYDFRGGDLRVFEEGRRTLGKEGALFEQLRISRRSAPPLVEWTNRAFAHILPPDGAPREPFEAAHGPLVAAPQAWETPLAPGDCPGVYTLAPHNWQDASDAAPTGDNIEGRRRRAADALASWLLELVADARAEGGARRQPDFAAINQAIARGKAAVAVLFADNSVKALFEEVLRARGVPFESLKGRGFWTSDAVRWSMLLLRALLDPDDEAAAVGLLRSPLGGQSDLALLERHVARRAEVDGWAPSDELDAAMWHTVLPRMARWRSLAGVLPVSDVLERALDESEVAFYEAGLHDAAIRRENWRKVLDLVRARETEGEGGLRALVDFFEANSHDDREPLAPLPSGASIQLMTVHASKGLGFPACVLAQLENAKREGGDQPLVWGEVAGATLAAFSLGREREEDGDGKDKPPAPLAYDILRGAAFERSQAEWKRLFYVACTRAQSHLVLLETVADAPANSWADFARPAMGGLRALVPALTENAEPPAPRMSETNLPPTSLEAPLPFVAGAAREVRFDALYGPPSSTLKDAAIRQLLERELRACGQSAADLRQDVPFGARGSLFGRREELVVGAWEWLAPLDAGGFLLAATGEDETAARARFHAMKCAAKAAGMEITASFALWDGGQGELQAASYAP